MAAPAVLQNTYKAGMKRDTAREALPQGALWNLVDFLPEVLGAVCRKRGGYGLRLARPGTLRELSAGIVAEYTAGQSVLALDGNAHLVRGRDADHEGDDRARGRSRRATRSSTTTWSSSPTSSGATIPRKITRSGATHTIAALGGSPPAGSYALIYKDVVWLGGRRRLPQAHLLLRGGEPGELGQHPVSGRT